MPMNSPACPYCGERQTKDEARPSKPRVVTRKAWERPHRAGQVRTIRETVYDDHCRACDERIVYGFTLGDGSLSAIATGYPRYHWSKP